VSLCQTRSAPDPSSITARAPDNDTRQYLDEQTVQPVGIFLVRQVGDPDHLTIAVL